MPILTKVSRYLPCYEILVHFVQFGWLLWQQIWKSEVTKLKGAYISLIIGHRGFGCENNLWEVVCPESFADFRFHLGALGQGQMSFSIPIMTYPYQGFRISSLLWNLAWLMLWSSLFSWVGCYGKWIWKSEVTKLKGAYISLIIGCRGCACKDN